MSRHTTPNKRSNSAASYISGYPQLIVGGNLNEAASIAVSGATQADSIVLEAENIERYEQSDLTYETATGHVEINLLWDASFIYDGYKQSYKVGFEWVDGVDRYHGYIKSSCDLEQIVLTEDNEEVTIFNRMDYTNDMVFKKLMIIFASSLA